jgi:hypothetical protein
VMHGAKLVANWDPAHGRPTWYALVPRDDGTIAAAVTAGRLSDGVADTPLNVDGNQIAVERLGRPGALLAARAGETLIFGSTRDELLRAMRSLPSGHTPLPTATGRADPEEAALAGPGAPFGSGAIFDLDPIRLATEPTLPLPARAAGELLRGLSCHNLHGRLALEGDCLGLDFSTLVRIEDAAGSTLWNGTAPIDPAWLESVPSSGAMAVAMLAFRPTREFWDSAFALADRVEKTDPARAELAPLRTRLNLLAMTSGIRLEADVWPHLSGLTAAVLGDTSRPGRPTGVLLALHLDSEVAAEKLVSQSARGLAKLIGREVAAWRKGRDVVVAWGNGVATAARDAAARPDLSVAPIYRTSMLQAGKPPPHRLVVFWPARCWPLEKDAFARSPAWSVMTDDPPALWLGWNQENKAIDSINWPGLERRVHRFLEQIPLRTAKN